MNEMTLEQKLEFNAMCRARILILESEINRVKISTISVCKECRKDEFDSRECDTCFDFDGFVEETCE
jgi:hypothetical protein